MGRASLRWSALIGLTLCAYILTAWVGTGYRGSKFSVPSRRLTETNDAPSLQCQNWCSRNTLPFSVKVTWPGCNGCTDPSVSTTNAPTPAPPASTTSTPAPLMCENWCARNTHPYDVKVTWQACNGCTDPSSAAPTPAPTASVIDNVVADEASIAPMPEEAVVISVKSDATEVILPPHRQIQLDCLSCHFSEQCPYNEDTSVLETSLSLPPFSSDSAGSDFESDFFVHESLTSCHRITVKVRYIRKELRELTSDEWNRYAAAVEKFKYLHLGADAEFPNYDSLVAFHAAAATNPRGLTEPADDRLLGDQAHAGPAFLAWHALLMYSFEKGIQAYDPSVAAHYWDWTDGDASAVFNSNFYGESNSEVDSCALTNGPFYNWTVGLANNVPEKFTTWLAKIHPDASPSELMNMQLRGQGRGQGLPVIGRSPSFTSQNKPATLSDISMLLEKANYSDFVCHAFWTDGNCTFRADARESHLHGYVHGWGAGSCQSSDGRPFSNDGADLSTSVNDPFFFGHHSMVERMHQAWQIKRGNALATDADPCGVYGSDFGRVGHGLHDVWEPQTHVFDKVNGDSSFAVCSNLFQGKAPYVYNKYFD